jgi:alpha-glucoside transport system permease protein
VAAAFLAPALVILGIWIVYPVFATIYRSFYDRSGNKFVGIDNYHALFTTPSIRTAIENNAIWVAVVPALVTAIGLVFAVLTERISWAVAFKTAVFMPMAVSLFAAGVIWHVMYEKNPSQGAVNALIGTVHDAIWPPGTLSDERDGHTIDGDRAQIAAQARQGRAAAAHGHSAYAGAEERQAGRAAAAQGR